MHKSLYPGGPVVLQIILAVRAPRCRSVLSRGLRLVPSRGRRSVPSRGFPPVPSRGLNAVSIPISPSGPCLLLIQFIRHTIFRLHLKITNCFFQPTRGCLKSTFHRKGAKTLPVQRYMMILSNKIIHALSDETAFETASWVLV